MQNVAAIKFKNNSKVHYINSDNFSLNINDNVVVITTRGKELGDVIKIGLDVNKNELSSFIVKIERIANNDDIVKDQQNYAKKDEVLTAAKELVKKLKLTMKLVDAEFILDGTKVIISFVCEDRVDFRELVKQLAHTLKMKIELKQIGTRDHAKLVGGIGPCGQECCCIRFLNDFDKVSVKMAKVQNLSLNPVKISGICDRLMCCLSYENDHYIEMSAKMPKVNSTVKTTAGDGVVIYNNLFKETCIVKIKNGDDIKIMEFMLSELQFNKDNTPNHCKNNCSGCKDYKKNETLQDEEV